MIAIFIIATIFLVCWYVGSIAKDILHDKQQSASLDEMLDGQIVRCVSSVDEGTFRYVPTTWSDIFRHPKKSPLISFYLDEQYDEANARLSLRWVLRCTHLLPTPYDFHSVVVKVCNKVYSTPFDMTSISNSLREPFNYAEVYGDFVETLVEDMIKDSYRTVYFVVIGADFKRRYTMSHDEIVALWSLYDFYQRIKF